MTAGAADEGQQVDSRLTLLTKISSGGMGEVYLADLAGVSGFHKRVAVKRIRQQAADDPDSAQRFINEACTAAAITHTNVCQIYDFFRAHGELFQVMELLRGVTVAEIHAQIDGRPGSPGSPIPLPIVSSLVAQACAGLHAAHQMRGSDGELAGLVHRDVSPNNLFLTVDGTLKLLDFGISKVQRSANGPAKTRTGLLRGKPAYMAPEQILGKPLDRRADIFSLGIVLHELLTGKRLFARFTDYDTLSTVLREAAPPPSRSRPEVPPELDDVVGRALSKEPSKRFADAEVFRKALTAAVPPAPRTDLTAFLSSRFAEEVEAQQRMLSMPAAAAEKRPRTVRIQGLDAASPGTGTGTGPLSGASRMFLALPPPPTDDTTSVFMPGLLATITVSTEHVLREETSRSASACEQPEAIAPEPQVAARLLARLQARLDMRSFAAGVGLAALVIAGIAATSQARSGSVPASAPVAVAVDAPAAPTPSPEPKITETKRRVVGEGVHLDLAEVTPTYSPPGPSEDARQRADSSTPARKDTRGDKQRQPHGYLTVDAFPYAVVYVDGKKLGMTPIIKHQLPEGRYRLRAESSEGSEFKKRIRIRSDQERILVFK